MTSQPAAAKRTPPANVPRPVRNAALLAVAVALAIAVWNLLSTWLGLSFWISRPSRVWQTLSEWVADGTLWPHLQSSIGATLVGFLIGAVLGISTALVVHSSRVVEDVISPFVAAAFALPKPALAPLLILLLGLGAGPKITLGALVTYFVVYHYVLDGFKRVPGDMLAAVRVMGGGRLTLYRDVLLPASRGAVVYACQLALPKAFTAVIVAEVIGTNRGLGYLTRLYGARFQAHGVFAAIVVMLVVSVTLYFALASISGTKARVDELGGS